MKHSENQILIRTVDPDLDFRDVIRLYESSLLDTNDSHDVVPSGTAGDLDDLKQTYLSCGDGSHFWVAQLDHQPPARRTEVSTIVGMIAARRTDAHTVEIRRLRVAEEFQDRGVGNQLIETALEFCQSQGYLKVQLDTRIERIKAIALFERHGFQLNRTRTIDGKLVHDFYLNLYRHNQSDAQQRHDDLDESATMSA